MEGHGGAELPGVFRFASSGVREILQEMIQNPGVFNSITALIGNENYTKKQDEKRQDISKELARAQLASIEIQYYIAQNQAQLYADAENDPNEESRREKLAQAHRELVEQMREDPRYAEMSDSKLHQLAYENQKQYAEAQNQTNNLDSIEYLQEQYEEGLNASAEKNAGALFSMQGYSSSHEAEYSEAAQEAFSEFGAENLSEQEKLAISYMADLPDTLTESSGLLDKMRIEQEKLEQAIERLKNRPEPDGETLERYTQKHEEFQEQIDQQAAKVDFESKVLEYVSENADRLKDMEPEESMLEILKERPDIALAFNRMHPDFEEQVKALADEYGVDNVQGLITQMHEYEQAAQLNAETLAIVKSYSSGDSNGDARNAFLTEYYTGDSDTSTAEAARMAVMDRLGISSGFADDLEVLTHDGKEVYISDKGQLYTYNEEGGTDNITDPLTVAELRHEAWAADPPKQYANEEISLSKFSSAAQRFINGSDAESVEASMGGVVAGEPPSTSVAKTVSDTVSGWGDGIKGMFKGHAEGTGLQPEEAKPDPAPDKTPAMEGRDTVRDEMSVGGLGN